MFSKKPRRVRVRSDEKRDRVLKVIPVKKNWCEYEDFEETPDAFVKVKTHRHSAGTHSPGGITWGEIRKNEASLLHA